MVNCNSIAAVNVVQQINFVREGEKARSVCTRQVSGQLRGGGAREMRLDIKQKLVVPAHVVSTQLCPHLILCSDLEKVA